MVLSLLASSDSAPHVQVAPHAKEAAITQTKPLSQHIEQAEENMATADTPPAAVVIVGGGPVGLLLALMLAQKGIRSAVLEKDEALNQSPRAVAFSGPVHHVFQEVGIYDTILQDAAQTPGFCWRKVAEDDGRGGKRLGEKVAEWRPGEPNEAGVYNPGDYVLQYPQDKIGQMLLDRCLETSLVTFHFGTELYAIDESKGGVSARAKSKKGNLEVRGQYLVGCDGGRSVVRRLMGVKMFGHSWSERFMTTDIVRTPPVVEEVNIDYIVNPDYWAITTPLERATPGKRTLWRYSMAITNDDIPDDEAIKPGFVNEMLLKHLDGPRPADFEVLRVNLYRMHQLLASTMFRNRLLLAGDAAHLTNPIGGLGLCTGMLDADALAQAFDLALNRYACEPKVQEECFRAYSAARRRVFQTVVHPMSSACKTRLQCGNPDEIAEEDWYMRTFRRGNKSEIDKMHDGLINHWRTNLAVELMNIKEPACNTVLS